MLALKEGVAARTPKMFGLTTEMTNQTETEWGFFGAKPSAKILFMSAHELHTEISQTEVNNEGN